MVFKPRYSQDNMGTNRAGVQRRCWVLRGAQGASAIQPVSRFTWLWPGSQAWAAGTVGREMLREQNQENKSLLSNTFTAGQKSGQVEKTSDSREAGSLIAKRSLRCCAWPRDDYRLIQLVPGTKQISAERLKAPKSVCGGWSRLHPAVRLLPQGAAASATITRPVLAAQNVPVRKCVLRAQRPLLSPPDEVSSTD